MIWTDVTRLNVTYLDVTWAACRDPSDVAELDLQQSEAASEKCPGPFTGALTNTYEFSLRLAVSGEPSRLTTVVRHSDVDEASGCMVNVQTTKQNVTSTVFFLAYSNE